MFTKCTQTECYNKITHSEIVFMLNYLSIKVHYMKNIIFFIFVFLGTSLAGEFYCNDGKTDKYGIPETSCKAISSNFNFGLLQSVDGHTNYYFIDFADIFFTIGNEHSVQLRYIINSNELNYNAIQALTQTAFATNASLSVIFKSPYLSQNLTTPGPYGRNLCYRYAGEGSSMVCHIDAMTILR